MSEQREIEYKTLNEIKLDIVKRIVNHSDSSPIYITRCYETLTGSTISRGVGVTAPDGKFKIQL